HNSKNAHPFGDRQIAASMLAVRSCRGAERAALAEWLVARNAGTKSASEIGIILDGLYCFLPGRKSGPEQSFPLMSFVDHSLHERTLHVIKMPRSNDRRNGDYADCAYQSLHDQFMPPKTEQKRQ